MSKKKKEREASTESRLSAIPVSGLTSDLAMEMLEDLSELNVVNNTIGELKAAIAELKHRKEDLEIRVHEWGSGYVPTFRKPQQMSLNLGDRFEWLQFPDQMRSRWQKASEVQRDYSPDWVSEASVEVEGGGFLTPETVPASEKQLMELEQLVEQAKLDGKSGEVELLAARVRKYAGKPRAEESLQKIREMLSERPLVEEVGDALKGAGLMG